MRLVHRKTRRYFMFQFCFSHDDPIIVRAGDEIKTTCIFQSDRDETVFFGLGTQDEMCLGFLTYYPRENFRQPGK